MNFAEIATITLMLVCLSLAFIPVVPSSALQWTIGILYGALGNFTRLTVPAAVIMTILMIAGSTSGVWLPYFGMRGKGLSCLGLIAFFIGCIIGTFIPLPIPFVGNIIGGVGAVVIVEYARIGEYRAALKSGGAALSMMILGFVFEFLFSLAIFFTFLISVLTTR